MSLSGMIHHSQISLLLYFSGNVPFYISRVMNEKNEMLKMSSKNNKHKEHISIWLTKYNFHFQFPTSRVIFQVTKVNEKNEMLKMSSKQ